MCERCLYIDKIHMILSDEEGCYNVDGFKLDFADALPKVGGWTAYEPNLFGIELLKRNIQNIFEISKKIKPEALITHSNVHPYFGEYTDMVRLHDYYACCNTGRSNMEKRTSIARAAYGDDVMIDTDAPGGFRRRDALQCFRHQAEYGVPDIYGIKLYSFFTDEDWAEVKQIYDSYIREMDEKFAQC